MRLEEFDYELPEELIAQRPLEDRAASRLLHLDRSSGAVSHLTFRQGLDLLREGDLLVLNDTRVSARRLHGRRATGAKVEALVMSARGSLFEALVKPAKRLRPGETIEFDSGPRALVVEDLGDGKKLLEFDRPLDHSGTVPLPPYVHESLQDEERYQTVYASTPGSSAAPTAGLHFTLDLLEGLRQRGVQTATVTLDVGLDTFRPVMVEEIDQHVMHGEVCTVSEETAEAVATCKGRIIAVGTTTVRTLESFANGPRSIASGSLVSRLFIRPGYKFRVIDGMFTNFHMPRTTMMMMISAMAGRDAVLAAYREAVQLRYRFLSFGDSMLIV
ncbi:MAG: tRNA preQ1(34) S-adenosylmethionine ribosyltransferase-isomerase QueA [Armatimonadetes bacterium]|nr:tRNA preQ1(34) S-adenosylmethionine ribosyltransferase-isomerase QueA [Armatimonadota bacterium]